MIIFVIGLMKLPAQLLYFLFYKSIHGLIVKIPGQAGLDTGGIERIMRQGKIIRIGKPATAMSIHHKKASPFQVKIGVGIHKRIIPYFQLVL